MNEKGRNEPKEEMEGGGALEGFETLRNWLLSQNFRGPFNGCLAGEENNGIYFGKIILVDVWGMVEW